MTPAEVRTLLRWAVSDPKGARRVAGDLVKKFVEAVPAVATAAGSYLLSEYLAKKLNLAPETKAPHPILVYFQEPASPAGEAPALPALVESKSAADARDSVRNTVGTTLEGKIHESFTVAADRLYQAGLMNTKERIGLSSVIGDILGEFHKKVPHSVFRRPMNDRAHDLLKSAVSQKAVERALQARLVQHLSPGKSVTKIRKMKQEAARSVAQTPVDPATSEQRALALKALRTLRRENPGKGGTLLREIRSLERTSDAQGGMF